MGLLSYMPIRYDERSMIPETYRLNGNQKIINEIINLSQTNIRKNVDLYKAMDTIKAHLKDKYGEKWFYDSIEAVEFIIENTYCDNERTRDSLPELKGILW